MLQSHMQDFSNILPKEFLVCCNYLISHFSKSNNNNNNNLKTKKTIIW